jgi:hypothetical protein
MPNNRIFYACQAVGIERCPTSSGKMTPIHGLQSVGVNTTFNLEQVFELGQIQIYENIEGIPDVEVTLEKVLDGYPLIYHLASSGATSRGLAGRSVERSCVSLGIYSDDKDAAFGVAPTEVYMSGMYISNVSYTFPTDGNCTESVTLVGNHKAWYSPAIFMKADVVKALNNANTEGAAGTDEPYALVSGVNHSFSPSTGPLHVSGAMGGIQRRENVLLASSILPTCIYGVNFLGYGNGLLNGSPTVHIQNFEVSTDFSRDDILELGRKAPYYRAAQFPIEVTSSFEVIAINGDQINAFEEGVSGYNNTRNEGNNTSQELIIMALQDGTILNLGSKNRLSSITYGGGDAGGGNATIQYSFTTFNDLIVQHPRDPRGYFTA